MTRIGLPHSEIRVSRLTCSSARLFAAYRVLLRLGTPRHPPYALISLTNYMSFAFLVHIVSDVYA